VALPITWIVFHYMPITSTLIKLLITIGTVIGFYFSMLYYFDHNIALSILEFSGIQQVISNVRGRIERYAQVTHR
jgi:hypothetical protein